MHPWGILEGDKMMAQGYFDFEGRYGGMKSNTCRNQVIFFIHDSGL